MYWTKERDDLLRKLWVEEPLRSYTLIAREMGGFEHTQDGGRSAIAGKARRLGLPKRGFATTRSAQNRSTGYRRPRYKRRPKAPAPPPVRGPVRAGTIKLFRQYEELTKSELQAMLRQAVINTGGKLVISGT